MKLETELHRLKDRIKHLKHQPRTSPDTLKWMSELAKSIEQHLSDDPYVTHLEEENQLLVRELNEAALVIRKQAIIIQTARVHYPTISQPIEQIWDIALATQGRFNEIQITPVPTIISIPVI
jgi:predicted nucleotidyltransferase